MARWNARAEFLLGVIELLFLYLLRLRRYKAKRVKTRRLQEWVGHFEPKFQGEGVDPGGIFFGFYKTRHILLSNGANCTLLRAGDRRPGCLHHRADISAVYRSTAGKTHSSRGRSTVCVELEGGR